MGLLSRLETYIITRNEALKSIVGKLKRIDKSLVCIAKEIRGLTNAIKARK